MAEFFSEYGLFLAKAVTVVVSILIVAAGIAALSLRGQTGRDKNQLEIKHLNKRYDALALTLREATMPKKAFKKLLKEQKKDAKKQKKDDRDGAARRVFVLSFNGDIRASQVGALREEISALLTVAAAGDEVLLKLESPGGMVNGYGLAASQLARITAKPLKLTVAVDKVAASGGYMMACVADRILAAPFALLGSIGVVAQVPNVHRLLKKNDVDFEQFTAGEYKRTVTIFGENSDQDRAKFQQDIDDTHQLFKEFVREHRPQLDVDKVATGEVWYGSQAVANQLIDELRTSDDYLLAARADADLYELKYKAKKPLLSKLLNAQETLLRRAAEPRWLHELPGKHLL